MDWDKITEMKQIGMMKLRLIFPFRQRHHINLNGGSETSKFMTFVASDQEGIPLGDKRDEFGGRINANFNLLDNFVEIIAHADYRKSSSERSLTVYLSSNEIKSNSLTI